MTELKDISKSQVLYDALMIVTEGRKYQIKDICYALINDTGSEWDSTTLSVISSLCKEIDEHLTKQGY